MLKNKITNVKSLKINHKKLQQYFKIGTLIYFEYIMSKIDETTILRAFGICIGLNKTSSTVVIKNKIKKEKIEMLFYYNSPLIINLYTKKNEKHKKKYHTAKLYYI